MDRDSELCKQVDDLTAINTELLEALKGLAKQEDWQAEDVSPDSPIGKAWKVINKAEGRS